jgi:hypothetical protein
MYGISVLYNICCHVQYLLPYTVFVARCTSYWVQYLFSGTAFAIRYSTVFVLRYSICSTPRSGIFNLSICYHIQYLLAMCNISCRVQYLLPCTAFFAVMFSICCHQKNFLSGTVSAGMSSRLGFLDLTCAGQASTKGLVKQCHMPHFSYNSFLSF